MTFDPTSFKEYMKHMGQSENTIQSYVYTLDRFLVENPDANSYTYSDIMDYLSKINDTTQGHKQRVLSALKKYYHYLIYLGIREAHPCNSVTIKSKSRSNAVIFQDLFTSQELELLLNREERYPFLSDRNKLILSLYIYQALTSEEIISIKQSHVDLDNLKLYIPSSIKQARRLLPIKPKQFRLFDSYINHTRKHILEQSKEEKNTNFVFINKLGQPMTDCKHLVDVFKSLFQDRNLTPMSIRQSVIANWLNEQNYSLEQVQLLAGHRWISSTLPYRKPNPERQRELINKWHPLG